MKTWTLSLAILGSALLTQTAHGDQCAWINAKEANKAYAVLAKQPKVLEFCEPCGDKAPGVPFVAQDVAIATPQGSYKEIQINGKGIDLAYTYVQTSPTDYRNLAKLAGCPASDVSLSLNIADETPHGVLIMPDDKPLPPEPVVEPPAPPPPPPVFAAPPPPPPPAPTLVSYYTTTIEHAVPWSILALAAAGGFISGVGFTLAVFAVRRRRAMRPRASDLPIA